MAAEHAAGGSLPNATTDLGSQMADIATLERGERISKTSVVRVLLSAMMLVFFLFWSQSAVALTQAGHLILVVLIALFLRRNPAGLSRLSWLQPVGDAARSLLDVAQVTFIVQLSGGLDSPFMLAYAIPVVFSSLAPGNWRGPLTAMAATIGALVCEIAAGLQWLPDHNLITGHPSPLTFWQTLTLALICGCGLLGISLIIARISNRTRAARQLAQETANDLAKLNEFSRLLNSTADLSSIFDEVYEFITENTPIDTLWLTLADEANNELYTFWGKRPGHVPLEEINFFTNLRIPLDGNGGTLAQTFERRLPFYLHHTARRSGHTVTNALDGKPYRVGRTDLQIYAKGKLLSFLQVPLVLNNKTIAVLNFSRYRESLHLSPEQIRRILTISEQITGSLYHAVLLEQVTAQREAANQLRLEAEQARAHSELAKHEIETLNDFSKEINATSDITRVLESVFGYMSRAFGFDGFVLMAPQKSAQSQHLRVLHHIIDGRPASVREFAREVRIPLDGTGGIIERAFQWKKPLLIPDVQRNIFSRPYPGMERDRVMIERFLLRGFLLLPLVVQGQSVAIILCSSSEVLKLQHSVRASIARFGEQIAGAVQHSRLMEETERARSEAEKSQREIAKLAEFGKRINESVDREHVLQSVFSHLQSEFHASACVLQLVDKERQELYTVSAVGAGSPADARFVQDLRVPLNESSGSLFRTYVRQKPFYVSRMMRTESAVDEVIVERLQLQSVAHFPLVIQGRTIGILWLSFGRNKRSGADIESIARFCEQIAGAIFSSNLLAEVQAERDRAAKAREQTEILAELSRRANEGRRLDDILSAFSAVLDSEFHANRLGLWMVDAHSRHLELRSLFYDGQQVGDENLPAEVRRIPLVRESGTLFRTFEKQKLFSLSNVRPELLALSPIDAAVANNLNVRWLVQVPLLVDKEVIAILAVTGTRHQRMSKDQLLFLDRLASQIAGAVRSFELLEKATSAREESDRLLANILPKKVAEELKREGHVEPLFYDEVSVLFTDFVGFTQATQKMRPDELVAELDGCFSQFDEVLRRNNMEKLKTIGDAYMCAAGLPNLSPTHAVDACLTALEFRAFMAQMAEVKKALGHEFWQIRIGIHCGPVTAGVIGTNKFAYDIWGDTVNTASRMESSGTPGEINISASTHDLVKDFFECHFRGKVQAKGKGEMDMYYVGRIKPELSADEDGLLPNGKFETMRAVLADPFYEPEAPHANVQSGRHIHSFAREEW